MCSPPPPAFLPQIALTCHNLPCRLFVGSDSQAHQEHSSCRASWLQKWWWQLWCCSTLYHQLRDAPITGQSNHSMKGEIFWLRAVLGTFLYYTQKSQTRRARLAWPAPVQGGVESSPPLRPTQYFFLLWLISPWQSKGRQQAWFCSSFSL